MLKAWVVMQFRTTVYSTFGSLILDKPQRPASLCLNLSVPHKLLLDLRKSSAGTQSDDQMVTSDD